MHVAPDLDRFPGYERATPLVAVLEEGDTLLAPAGWWHYAVSLTASIMVMRNFWSADTNGKLWLADQRAAFAARVAALRDAQKKGADHARALGLDPASPEAKLLVQAHLDAANK